MVRPRKNATKQTRVSARINGQGTAALEHIMRTLGVNKNQAIEIALNAVRDNFSTGMLQLYYDTIKDDI